MYNKSVENGPFLIQKHSIPVHMSGSDNFFKKYI